MLFSTIKCNKWCLIFKKNHQFSWLWERKKLTLKSILTGVVLQRVVRCLCSGPPWHPHGPLEWGTAASRASAQRQMRLRQAAGPEACKKDKDIGTTYINGTTYPIYTPHRKKKKAFGIVVAPTVINGCTPSPMRLDAPLIYFLTKFWRHWQREFERNPDRLI